MGAAPQPKIRPATVAGQFYPESAAELGAMVDGFLARAAAPAPSGPVVALVSPHAGYPYSGPVAAYAYALLKNRKPDRVVLIAPSHTEAFDFAAVYDGDAYTTPLGAVPVDKAFAAKLASAGDSIKLSSRGHMPRGQPEHALEVQLPFLQRVLGEFKVVPVVMGAHNYEACRALGAALANLARGSDTLIVASSDLSHFHAYDDAVKLDRKTLRAIEAWDYLNLARNLEMRVWEACGGGPIVAAMIAAERMGATRARVLKYANSGDATGDRRRVVGYGAIALTKESEPRASAGQPFSLTQADEGELLRIAKSAVEMAVKDRKLYDCAAPKSDLLLQESGAFVTLKKHGRLRGCVGYIAPVKPLYLTVRDVAVMAALKDQRFNPVSVAELPELQYEVSVLSPVRRVLDPKRILVGRDGLILRRGDREGVLLPQIPVEQKWNRATFLEQLCYKAGLPARAWQDDSADLFSFTSVVFPK